MAFGYLHNHGFVMGQALPVIPSVVVRLLN